MTNLEIGYVGVVAILVLIALRIPIGVALGGVSILGIMAMRGPNVAAGLVKSLPFEFIAHWSLSAIPMFLLMGAVAHRSGMSSAVFQAAYVWMGRLPGGLAVACNIGCAAFSAASGSSMATAAAMGRLTIPQMLRFGYDPGLATGVVAAAGTLGSLIPPSILLILYGIFAEVSIAQLLIAGIIPGIVTALIYTAMIVLRASLNPSLAPRVSEHFTTRQRMAALGEVWPIALLIVGIIGGIYGGVFTPTEAGAVGAFLAFVIAGAQRRMNLQIMRTSVLEALVTSGRILFIALGAVLFQRFLALSGMPFAMGQMIGDWAHDPVLLVLATSLIYIVLGMFLSPLGLLLVTLPLVLPMFRALGVDLIWVGILVIKYLEIGLVTPPVGLNVYIIKSVVGDRVPLETIFKGVLWFLVCDAIVIALLVIFPEMALFLPRLMQ